MPVTNGATPYNEPSPSPNEYILEVLKDLKEATDYDKDNLNAAYDDFKFFGNRQWTEDELRERSNNGKATVMINILNSFVSQIMSDFRLSKPRIKVTAEGGGSILAMKQVIEGIIRKVLYKSNFDEITDRSAEHMLIGGFGYWKFETAFTPSSAFNQEIVVRHIKYPLNVRFDPAVDDMTKENADYCFILKFIPRRKWKKLFPDKAPVSIPMTYYTDLPMDLTKYVICAEHWYREPYTRRIAKLSTGQELDYDIAEDVVAEAEASYNLQKLINPMLPDVGLPRIVDDTEVEDYKVYRELISGVEVVEEAQEFPCSIIPVVPIWGKEVPMDGKRWLMGVVRGGKESQKGFNFIKSEILTSLGNIPQALMQATPEMVDGFEEDYDVVNRKASGVLLYNPVDGGGKPEPIQKPSIPPELIQAANSVIADLKFALGINDPTGQGGGQFAPAEYAKQRIADENQFMFMDNYMRALKLSGRILLNMIPKVYDNERIVHIRDAEDKEIDVVVNTITQNKMGLYVRLNDLRVGNYDIEIDAGPSNTTARLQASQTWMELILKKPEWAPLLGDLALKSSDVLYSDIAYDRFRKLILPQELGGTPKDPSKNPQMIAMQMEMQKRQMDMLQEKFKTMRAAYQAEKARNDAKDNKKDVMEDVFRLLEQLLVQPPEGMGGQPPIPGAIPPGTMPPGGM